MRWMKGIIFMRGRGSQMISEDVALVHLFCVAYLLTAPFIGAIAYLELRLLLLTLQFTTIGSYNWGIWYLLAICMGVISILLAIGCALFIYAGTTLLIDVQRGEFR